MRNPKYRKIYINVGYLCSTSWVIENLIKRWKLLYGYHDHTCPCTCVFEDIYWFQLEPFAPRHSITYFNNNKEESAKSAYKRLHSLEFDLSKPRCDRAKPDLYWLEISRENKGHKVPMTTNLWYGRPNRVQVDFPETKFNRSSKMQEFYTRCGFSSS